MGSSDPSKRILSRGVHTEVTDREHHYHHWDLTKDEQTKIQDLHYRKRLSTAEISQRTGISSIVIRTWFQDNGWEIGHKADLIVEKFAKGQTIEAISKEVLDKDGSPIDEWYIEDVLKWTERWPDVKAENERRWQALAKAIANGIARNTHTNSNASPQRGRSFSFIKSWFQKEDSTTNRTRQDSPRSSRASSVSSMYSEKGDFEDGPQEYETPDNTDKVPDLHSMTHRNQEDDHYEGQPRRARAASRKPEPTSKDGPFALPLSGPNWGYEKGQEEDSGDGKRLWFFPPSDRRDYQPPHEEASPIVTTPGSERSRQSSGVLLAKLGH